MKSVPINDTSRISKILLPTVLDEIANVINSGRWLLGDKTNDFADAFCKYLTVDYCLPVANGTDALELALKCLSTEGQDEVVTVANAGGYTSTACYLAGLKPIYVDVSEHNMLMDISQLEKVLNRKTVAVVVTHLYGRAVDVKAVRIKLDSLGFQNVKILEDCAQAHGAKIGGVQVGSLGDLATFSFYPTKNLGALGDAGAITTKDKKLFQRVKALSQYGWSSKYSIETKYGRNSRMDEVQAVVLSHLLPMLDLWNVRRREIYKRYMSEKTDLVFYTDLSESNVIHLAIARTKNREKFVKYMGQNGISVDIHYPILDCEQQAWKGDQTTHMEISKMLSDEIVTLPCFPMMEDSEVDRVCEVLRGWKNE